MITISTNFKRRIVYTVFAILLLTHNVFASDAITENTSTENNNLNSDTLLKSFLKKYEFNQLYLVFAGPYPSSPTSSFGHIFALIEPVETRPLLMWDAIDYAADISEYSSINFFWRGIFSNLNGYYKILPFYEKLREYTFIESRPLWLFPIEMDEKQSIIFLTKLFETQNRIYPYRFSNRNCASEIYRLINNSINKFDDLNNILILPNRVINNIAKEDSVIFIESTNSKLAQYNIRKTNKSQLNSSITDSKIKLMYLEWRYYNERTLLSEFEQEELRSLRKIVLETDEDDFTSLQQYYRKFSMHPTMMANVGYRHNTDFEHFYTIGYRFGLHEIFDRSRVYPKHDFLTLFRFEIGLTETDIFLNKFMLFEQTSLQPVSILSNSASWNIGLGIYPKKELNQRQLAKGLFLKYGYTFPIINEDLSLSFLLNTEPVYLNNYSFNVLLGIETVVRWHITEDLKFVSIFRETAKNIADVKFYYLLENYISINLTNNIALLFSTSLSKYNQDYSVNLHLYFN